MLAFVVAMSPVLGAHVWHETRESEAVRLLSVSHRRELASVAAASIARDIDQLERVHRVSAGALASQGSSRECVSRVCQWLDATSALETSTEFVRSAAVRYPLCPGRAGEPGASDTDADPPNWRSYELITPVRLDDGTTGDLVTKAQGSGLASWLPEPRRARGPHLCAILSSDGRVVALKHERTAGSTEDDALSRMKLANGAPESVISCPVCGEEIAAAAASVLGTTWKVLIAETPQQAAFAPLPGDAWLATTAAALALGIIVMFVAGNRIGCGIRRVTYVANAIAVGDYRRRAVALTRDELGALAKALNAVGDSLTEREAAMRKQADMLTRMADAARIASSSLDMRECGKAIAKAVCTHLGARDATVFRRRLLDGGVRVVGYCGRRCRSSWKLVANRAAESGDYLVISERSAPRAQPDAEEAFLVGVPLLSGEGPLGAIVARFDHTVNKNDLRLGSLRAEMLAAFGVHAAAAISNAEAYSETERQSEVLKNSVDQLSSIVRVTDAISPSLTLDETLAALARTTVAVLSVDVCGIFLPDRSGLLVVRGFYGIDGEVAVELRIRPGETETGLAFAEKRSVTRFDTRKARCRLTRQLSERIGMCGLLSTPLAVDDRAIGAITVCTSQPRKFAAREIELLESIAQHAAVIVRNAGLYTREASIAETLQSSLVFEVPEECRGLRMAGRYLPALDEARVGGDFYDVTPLPNDKIGVVIADVSGKGLSAAIHLATCKYMMKALMYAHPDRPAAVLYELNEALNYYFDVSFFVTMFYGVIDPVRGTIEYANAGHLPGLLVTRSGLMHTCLSGTGTPLGSGSECRYEARSVQVSPEDTLLLYTDGFTDAVRGGGFLGVEGLHRMVFDAGRCSVAELVQYLEDQLNTETGWSQRDDVALLAISFDSVAGPWGAASGGESEHSYCLPAQTA